MREAMEKQVRIMIEHRQPFHESGSVAEHRDIVEISPAY
jgi:hypothetical protein